MRNYPECTYNPVDECYLIGNYDENNSQGIKWSEVCTVCALHKIMHSIHSLENELQRLRGSQVSR